MSAAPRRGGSTTDPGAPRMSVVIVTPDSSRMAVLIAGRPKAGMVPKVPSAWPPTCAGPLVGHAALNSGHSSILLKGFVPSPPSQGTASCRA